MQHLATNLSYKWKPFLLDGVHLTFKQHVISRLEQAKCSHWGSAIYKWEGEITQGINGKKTGVLIGETGDLRQRVKQYISGTQPRGNKLWRESFLTQGDIQLYILDIKNLSISEDNKITTIKSSDALNSNNIRLLLEQLLVSKEVAKGDNRIWVVNARQ